MHTGARARKQKCISIYISLYMKTFLKTGVYIYIYIYETNSHTTFSTCLLLCLFVCLRAIFIRLSSFSFVCYFVFSPVSISYTFYLAVHFNCINRPVFKAPEFPCIQYKHCNRYLYQPATSLHPMAGLPCYFYLPLAGSHSQM